METKFSVKIGGQAGQGVKSIGLMLAKTAIRSGYYTYNYTEYPSLIRGGHNITQVNISLEEVLSPSQITNFLIALNQETIDLHLDELIAGSCLLFDGDSLDTTKVSKEVTLFAVPLSKITKEAGGAELLSNTVALGVTTALLGGSLEILKELIAEEFADKPAEIITANQKAAELGFNFAKEHFATQIKSILRPQNQITPKMVINGNDAVALGSIAAGMQFAAIYPMSPISGIIQTLALHQEECGFIYKQPEDEIAAMNMAIGASFAGARSMTATSGGGFCLMTEGYGLAGMTETPVVIINGMRPGPATGLPTWSDQGDLQFILHAAQGEFPKIVLAPGDTKETFELTMQAFNLADKYQTPVVVLIDKNICEDETSLILPDTSSFKINRGKLILESEKDYQRYALSEDGISPRAIPGSGNYFIGNSYAHDTEGFSTEDIKTRKAQMEKRMSKLQTCAKEDMPKVQLYGPAQADITLVSWGSNKGAILQAINNLPNVNFLHLTWMSPFPKEEVKAILSTAKHIIDIECNYSGQLASLIKEQTGIEIEDKLLKYDGRPFFAEEIIEKVQTSKLKPEEGGTEQGPVVDKLVTTIPAQA